ncbi:protein kinase domain-containing protein [Frigoriglobus tundricola]|uniref:Protein kinase domain-containing protein n=1 Tax=Frigoriglobus tundricola TaxID=2774151 RepID=A0A6M5YZT1_9BACT|nr:protein kinase [Frigoriglobus tundricola]QJW99569.1 hypothetical protein FTUN_7181 [Frigoriglobus tundricola]
MTDPTCPQTVDLLALLSGHLPPDRADAVEAHVEGCPVCLARAAGLPVENPLVREIRCGLPRAAPVPNELAPLIARLSSLYPTLTSGRLGATPPGGVDDVVRNLAPARGAGELGRLAHYRVLEVIGVGGMGVVFRAEDTTLRRDVALKVMRPRPGRDAAGRAWFLREARAMAGVRHDHIVVVHQVGEEAGQDGRPVPFLAMELLTGEGLDGWLHRVARTPPEWVARIGRQAAAGLAAAHAAGLVHRDVKPANLWLEAPPGWSHDPTETRQLLPAVARVKVLDFGLAVPRAEGAGEIIGTLAYMAPEQLAGAPADARSDLFGLGCVLYELCTGHLPYLKHARAADRPPLCPVRSHAPDVPPEMAALIERMLAESPVARPASARQVEQELARIEPSERPRATPGRSRPRRWHRRSIVIGTAVAATVTLGGAAWVLGAFGRRTPNGPGSTPGDVPTMTQEVLQLEGIQNPVNDIVYLSDDRAVTVDTVGTLSIWDTTTGRPVAKHLVTPNARLLSVAIARDGSQALIGGSKRALVYDLKAETVTAQLALPSTDEVWQVSYVPGGTTALLASLDGTARLWDLASGAVVRTFSCGKQAVWTAAVSPDGRWVATGGGGALRAQSWDYAVRIWDLATGRQVHELTGHTGDVRQLAFTPDSRTVVSGGFDGAVRMWDVVAGKERRTILAHTAFVERVAVLPDGRRALSVGGGQLQQDGQQLITSDVAVRMWDIETGHPLAQWTGHRRGVRTLAVSPNGKQFLTGSDDRTARLWDIP